MDIWDIKGVSSLAFNLIFQEVVTPSFPCPLLPDPMFTKRRWGTVSSCCVKSTI